MFKVACHLFLFFGFTINVFSLTKVVRQSDV